MVSTVFYRADCIPGQGTVEAALTDVIVRIIEIRECNIGYYSAVLGAGS